MTRVAAALAAALVVSSCGHNFDVEKAVAITDVHTGWYDAGIVQGKNKLVPSISLKLQNTSNESVESVQINAIFWRLGATEEWSDHFAQAIDRQGISPGQIGGLLVLRSEAGYMGPESRLQLLQNKQFVDARVEIFAKHGSRAWQKLGEYKIDRQLLTQ